MGVFYCVLRSVFLVRMGVRVLSGVATVNANHLEQHHNVNISFAQEARTTLMQANIAEAVKTTRQGPEYKRHLSLRWSSY
ncbi:hypothetical protein V1509DRAFT_616177 [Lipomyces kononenkoae]